MLLPKISLILFAYNQEQFILDAALSCLSQDYQGPLEIFISDDCSTDNTFGLIQNLAENYNGRHTLTIHRNAHNLGIGAHYNYAISRTGGQLIFTAAGDDISFPERISTMVNAWINNGERADLITSNLQKIRTDGSLSKEIFVSDLSFWKIPEQWIKKRPYVVGAGHAFTRRLHDKFGDFLPTLVYEDQVMAFRATLAGGGLKVDQSLVFYREGGISQGKSSLSTAEDYQRWSFKNFSLQQAQYLQIQKDLKIANRLDLWPGKLSRRLQEASLVLMLHKNKTLREKINTLLSTWNCNLFFKLKHFFYLSSPNLAINIQRIQQKFKK